MTTPKIQAQAPQQDLMSSFEKKKLSYALRLGILAGIVGFVAVWLLFEPTQTALVFYDFTTGTRPAEITVGGLCLILTLAISFACCMVTYRALYLESDSLTPVERVALQGRQNWVARITISITTTIIVTGVAWLLWILVGVMFTNLRVPFANALLITTLYATAIAYYITYWVSDLPSSRMMWLAIATFALGLMGSFLLADDPEWWRESLSYLGVDSGSNTLFNLSVISVGIIILTIWRDLINTLNILAEAELIPRWSLNALAVGSTISSLGIIGVGVFPVGVTPFTHFMHNLSVQGAVIICMIGMLGMRWLIPNIYHENFLRLGYAYAGLCVVFFLLYQFTNMLNFVALEIFCFVVITLWLYYLNEYTLLYIRQQDVEMIEKAVEKANRPLWEQLNEALSQQKVG
ncbi:MAG: hypothetical protein AAFR81_25760 [Chloroflexota bacterium]